MDMKDQKRNPGRVAKRIWWLMAGMTNQLHLTLVRIQSEFARRVMLVVSRRGTVQWLNHRENRYPRHDHRSLVSLSFSRLALQLLYWSHILSPRDWNVTFSVNDSAQGVISDTVEASVDSRSSSGTCSRILVQVPGQSESVRRVGSRATLHQKTQREKLLFQRWRQQWNCQGLFSREVSRPGLWVDVSC